MTLLPHLLKSPALTGAVAPSSQFLARAMADAARGAGCLIELGAGTGPVTRALVSRFPDTPLTVVELQPTLARKLLKAFPGARVLARPAAQVLDEIDLDAAMPTPALAVAAAAAACGSDGQVVRGNGTHGVNGVGGLNGRPGLIATNGAVAAVGAGVAGLFESAAGASRADGGGRLGGGHVAPVGQHGGPLVLVSSLPFRSLPPAVHAQTRDAILRCLARHPGSWLVQFTYHLRAPFEDVPGWRWRRGRTVVANIPPATVWTMAARH
jgi:phospholipid N-methyltransferase